ncbi:hypothetical protein H696_02768 [Fonticula alba]|uniref:Kinesin motor domain-containing protein n=1 Tax=Fonticula alba TaxID=691883 RepID=A0A058Z8J1_FONAL|nr:hypothetical protein H696_02768 [Fonticula alba]KCV70426.1 hypothetical protein H696_02768 [Fonticula alba]|eukprot:XP_009494942.1 hypothetical protein H696_02768 [Fonticula alba]
MSSVKVFVRVRPFNGREKAAKSKRVISMNGQSTTIEHNGKRHDYAFDNSYWSFDAEAPNYASQEIVYQEIGVEMVNHSFDGYNCCLFAYGQTGSGKSYSMMGYGPERGLIPRICEEIFSRIEQNSDPDLNYTVEVSYLEIYNEKVKDLLNPKGSDQLRVREHKTLGPYVEGLAKVLVSSFADIDRLMDEGNKARTVAATNMNETSSRSHAVFTMIMTQRQKDLATGLVAEKVSKIALVDLAGSERADSTGATGARLREGSNINKSLTALGMVISALADMSADPKKKIHIPYRDSVLTWLLKDNLGGNSKTCMLAALSPAEINYDETLSTLRYADRAKRIVNKATVNEDQNARMIRELREEVARLRAHLMSHGIELPVVASPAKPAPGVASPAAKPATIATATSASEASAGGPVSPSPSSGQLADGLMTSPSALLASGSDRDIAAQIRASERLVEELSESVETKRERTEAVARSRAEALADMGVSLGPASPAEGSPGLAEVSAPRLQPHLVNLNEDPLMNECLLYNLRLGGTTLVGSERPAHIVLGGARMLKEHCIFETSEDGLSVRLRLASPDAPVYINGKPLAAEDGASSSAPGAGASAAAAPEAGDDGATKAEPDDAASEASPPAAADATEEAPPAVDAAKQPGPMGVLLKSGDRLIFGLHYVFRFTNPIEVRAQRESAAASTTTAATEGESPSSGEAAQQPIADWAFALEELRQQQLSEQMAAVEAVSAEREARIRAEEERLESERQAVAAQVAEVQARMQEIESSNSALRAAAAAAATNGTSSPAEEPPAEPPLSPEQAALARRALVVWKACRRSTLRRRMAQLTPMLTEANVISAELNRGVALQFVISDPGSPFSTPAHDAGLAGDVGSPWEQAGRLLAQAAAGATSEPSSESHLPVLPSPELAIRVYDSRLGQVHLWSEDKFLMSLHAMRDIFQDPTSFTIFITQMARASGGGTAGAAGLDASNRQLARLAGPAAGPAPGPGLTPRQLALSRGPVGRAGGPAMHDPFSASGSWFSRLGSGHLYLWRVLSTHMAWAAGEADDLLLLDTEVSLFDEHGRVVGFVRVALHRVSPDGLPPATSADADMLPVRAELGFAGEPGAPAAPATLSGKDEDVAGASLQRGLVARALSASGPAADEPVLLRLSVSDIVLDLEGVHPADQFASLYNQHGQVSPPTEAYLNLRFGQTVLATPPGVIPLRPLQEAGPGVGSGADDGAAPAWVRYLDLGPMSASLAEGLALLQSGSPLAGGAIEVDLFGHLQTPIKYNHAQLVRQLGVTPAAPAVPVSPTSAAAAAPDTPRPLPAGALLSAASYHTLLLWVEVLEQDWTGDYASVPVSMEPHTLAQVEGEADPRGPVTAAAVAGRESATRGIFLVRQGVQRRLRLYVAVVGPTGPVLLRSLALGDVPADPADGPAPQRIPFHVAIGSVNVNRIRSLAPGAASSGDGAAVGSATAIDLQSVAPESPGASPGAGRPGGPTCASATLSWASALHDSRVLSRIALEPTELASVQLNVSLHLIGAPGTPGGPSQVEVGPGQPSIHLPRGPLTLSKELLFRVYPRDAAVLRTPPPPSAGLLGSLLASPRAAHVASRARSFFSDLFSGSGGGEAASASGQAAAAASAELGAPASRTASRVTGLYELALLHMPLNSRELVARPPVLASPFGTGNTLVTSASASAGPHYSALGAGPSSILARPRCLAFDETSRLGAVDAASMSAGGPGAGAGARGARAGDPSRPYVRGEEVLQGWWKPLSAELVDLSQRLRVRAKAAAAAERTRQLLTSLEQDQMDQLEQMLEADDIEPPVAGPASTETQEERQQRILARVVALLAHRAGRMSDSSADPASGSAESVAGSASEGESPAKSEDTVDAGADVDPNLGIQADGVEMSDTAEAGAGAGADADADTGELSQPGTLGFAIYSDLVETAKLDRATCQGYLNLLVPGPDAPGAPAFQWVRRYAVLRRPYLLTYTNAGDASESAAILVSHTIADYWPLPAAALPTAMASLAGPLAPGPADVFVLHAAPSESRSSGGSAGGSGFLIPAGVAGVDAAVPQQHEPGRSDVRVIARSLDATTSDAWVTAADPLRAGSRESALGLARHEAVQRARANTTLNGIGQMASTMGSPARGGPPTTAGTGTHY